MSNYKYSFNLHELYVQDISDKNILKLFHFYNENEFKLLKHSVKYNSEIINNILKNCKLIFDEDIIYAFDKSFDFKKISPYKSYFLNFCKYRNYKSFPEINFLNSEVESQQYFLFINYPDWCIKNYNQTINYENIENIKSVQCKLLKYKSLKAIPEYPGEQCYKKDFWIFRGWTKEYAEKKIHEIQLKNSLTCRKKVRENPDNYKGKPTQLSYWIKQGYSEDEAIQKVKERQRTFTLEKCIEKYGEEAGKQRWQERQNKWQKTLQSNDNYIEIVSRRCRNTFVSNISQEFFNSIYEGIKNLNIKVYYASLNHEYGIAIHKRGGVLYDFVIPELYYAIEYNGERWHPRKDKLTKNEWKEWVNPFTKEDASTVYKRDLQKNNALIKKGYTLDIIWNNDYIENKEQIVNIIIEKIKKLYYDKVDKS